LSPYQILICVSIYTMLVLCPRCFFWTTCLLGYSDFAHVFYSICILPLSNLIALIFKKFLETYQYFELVIRNLNMLCPFHNHYFGLHSHETTSLWSARTTYKRRVHVQLAQMSNLMNRLWHVGLIGHERGIVTML